jgi:hypothetical protein
MAHHHNFAGRNFEFTGLDMRSGCRKPGRDESKSGLENNLPDKNIMPV